MADSSGSRQCFSCDAKFDTDDAFWDHIYNEDCGTTSKGDGLHTVKDTASEVKPVQSFGSSDKAPVKQANSLERSDAADSPFVCALCELSFPSSSLWYAHSKSDEHRTKLSSAANQYTSVGSTKKDKPATVFKTSEDVPRPRAFCFECQVPLPSEEAKEIHIRGKKHQKVMNQILKDNLFDNNTALGFSSTSSSSTGPEENIAPSQVSGADLINGLSKTSNVSSNHELFQSFYCDYCQMSLPDRQSAQKHVSSKEHAQLVQLQSGTQAGQSRSTCASLIEQLKAGFHKRDPSQVDQLITLLRRLCLAQLLTLMQGLEQSAAGQANITKNNQSLMAGQPLHLSSENNIDNVLEKDLLELFRAVCRDELERMWSSGFPSRLI